eukprot:scaffold89949_cov24-Tisochrysis_lutea.AAC.1
MQTRMHTCPARRPLLPISGPWLCQATEHPTLICTKGDAHLPPHPTWLKSMHMQHLPPVKYKTPPFNHFAPMVANGRKA